ncbi:hypothetical protein pb186bvf_016200 [Paramecium bursaria]
MKQIRILIIASVFTSIFVSQLLKYDLFLKPQLSKISCIQWTDRFILDLVIYENKVIFLDDDGLFDQHNQNLYTNSNCASIDVYHDQFYVICNGKIIILDKQFQEIKFITLPENIQPNDIVVFNEKILITQKLEFKDIIYGMLGFQSKYVLQCQFDGFCEFNYSIQGVSLDSFQRFNTLLYISDTFDKSLKIYDKQLDLINKIRLSQGPQRFYTYDSFFYITTIPKLIEIFNRKHYGSMIIDLNERDYEIQSEIFNFQFQTYAQGEKQIFMGNMIC